VSGTAKLNAAIEARHCVRILLVDDDAVLRRDLGAALDARWPGVVCASDGQEAMRLVSDRDRAPFHVVLSAMFLLSVDGVAILRAARERESDTAVVLMASRDGVDSAVSAMSLGAYDVIAKPAAIDRIVLRVARAVEHGRLLDEVKGLRDQVSTWREDFIVANSASMRDIVETARSAAAVRATVLLTGETGTGKEVIAGLIHSHSPRASGPFVKVNCAALPETLLESELFGHERGAYTGADQRRIGLFERASEGTLLLDEIAETSPATQVKLLRVLQDQEFYRLGGTEPLRTNARIIAATNRDLRAALQDGSLREDFYYRINVIQLHLAPLRERREDIKLLAERYRERFARELGRPCTGFTGAAMDLMIGYPWPGNVRELRNAIERSVLLAQGTSIDSGDLHLASAGLPAHGREWQIDLPPDGLSLHTVERALVLAALRRTGFVQKDAAPLIGVSQRKLNYMIARMGIVHESWRRNREPNESSATLDVKT